MSWGQGGSTLIMVAVAVMVLLGIGALVTDVALALVHRQELQQAADLAALAGAQELPENPDAAVAVATSYLLENGIGPGEVGNIHTDRENREIDVRVRRSLPLALARLLGFGQVQVSARATAAAYPVAEASRVVPWGQEAQDLVYGREYRLKWRAPDPSGGCCHGNYQILNLTGSMRPNQYEEWVASDYDGPPIRAGQRVLTRTGTLGNHTVQGLERRKERNPDADCTPPAPDPDCPLIVTVPVVRSFVDINGVGEVEVLGFARFLVTRTEPDISGNVAVYGVYLTDWAELPASPAGRYFGLTNISLVR